MPASHRVIAGRWSAMRNRSTSGGTRSGLPVLTYLALSFGLSVAALIGLLTSTTVASSHNERHRVPVQGPNGRTGALAMVISTSAWPIDVPADLPAGSAVVQLDSARRTVISTSGNAAALAGRPTAGTGLDRALPATGTTIGSFDHS